MLIKRTFEERVDPRGRSYYWLAGDPMEDNEVPGTDGYAVMNNKVSITPVRFDMTHYEYTETLKGLIYLKIFLDFLANIKYHFDEANIASNSCLLISISSLN